MVTGPDAPSAPEARPEAGLRRNPPSHWLAQVDPAGVPVVAALPAEVEVVVVGGGLMGVATAYWLARSGVLTLVVEARRLGWGASGRSGGLLLPGRPPLEDPALVDEVLAEEGIEADLEAPGHLALASSADMMDAIRAEVAGRPAGAPALHALDRAECEELLGLRLAAAFAGGRWEPAGGLVHPARLVYGLAAGAVRRGALVALGTAAGAITRLPGDRLAVSTSRGPVRTRAVVVACAGATGRLVPELAPVLRPVRGQVLATAPVPALFRFGMGIDQGTAYWRQAPDGAIVLGGLSGVDPVAEATAGEAVNWRIQSALRRLLPEVFPGLPRLRVARRWAGIMDVTPDGAPVAGECPDGSGIWVLAGFGGRGLPPALGAGRALAGSVAAGRLDPGLERLRPGRFGETRS
jgi:glycine/D-amino acid oxidase-like deaminating enzyme